ncbi:cation transporter [Stetteria hydrogenophila]
MGSRRALRSLYLVSLVSTLLAVVGFLVYVAVFPSHVVLVEAFIWLVEGISFFSLAIAFHIASSRATMYRARFEIFRIEVLSTLFLSIIAASIVILVVAESLHGGKGSTPIILSLYPLASALASYLLERFLHKSMHYYEVRLVSVRTVASKLSLDIVFELAGGLSIIASNVFHNAAIETAVVLLVGVYTLYGLSSIFLESIYYLIGVGPKGEVERIKDKMRQLLEGDPDFKPRSFRVEMYGTFGEAEVWIEAPPHITLAEASFRSTEIARKLVSSIPELLRALVIMVPRNKASTRSLRRAGKAKRVRGRKPRHYNRAAKAAAGRGKTGGREAGGQRPEG